jgi:beta-lactamase class A
VRIDAGNLSPGNGGLKGTEPGAEKTARVGELLELMMRDSDNTATDLLLASAGGPPAVTRHVHGLGLTGLEVNRPAAQLVADAWGFKLPPPGERTSKALSRAQRTVPPSKRAEAVARFLEDARDTTTPDAMVALLERLRLGKALGAQSTELLIDHMENCRTGTRRLKGELPRGTVVAHKTGTLLRVATNDVGIITLPWGNGPVIIAIYLKGSPLPLPAQERSVAAAALVAYRHFSR